ncbi:DUF6270 domain-containing protein [Alkalicoccobacillus porphyridii]|uniref:Uncharacterized protein n=1 Tax=Alkalicoccobacillus porphyridii TaxID=2597270 RepID=A0A554A306_9BACI|nr:DUF6270 domain-containing protein [Alkalicoccobacillus porphyridii]TSB48072.1 hypothetical protein FN960_00510 [Alkalicoccobacillus porphyridii]
MNITTSIIGSCVSRDNFNSAISPNYKEYFDMKVYQYHMSMISLMADRIPFEEKEYSSKLEYFYKEHFITELNKTILERLRTIPTDYLILDFSGDCLHGVVQYNDSYITNTYNYFKHINLYQKNAKGKLTIEDDPETYFELWKESVDKFMDYKNTYLPKTKVVINKARLVNEYYDSATGQLKSVTQIRGYIGDIEFKNKMWSRMDQYIIENHDVKYMDYGDFNYKANSDHKWGPHYVHYTDDFYYDFNKKLLKIALDDLLEKKEASKPIDEEMNLAINGDFSEGKEYWSHWVEEFKVENDETDSPRVMISSLDAEKDMYFQCWTNAMRVEANGKREYKITFKIRVKNKELIKNPRIFAVRVFRRLFLTAEKDSVYSDYVILPSDIEEGEWVTLEHTIKPLTGLYAKIGPFLVRNGEVEYKDIKLTLLK